jgi:hypothetical protein
MADTVLVGDDRDFRLIEERRRDGVSAATDRKGT